MDLVSYLKEDHESLRKFIQEVESADNSKVKEKIFSEMCIFLHAYFRAVETSVYARCLKLNIFELNELALDGYEEHHLIEDLIYRIKDCRNEEALWITRLHDFCKILDLHLAAETADYYPELKNHFSFIELERAAVIYLKTKKSELNAAEQEQGHQQSRREGHKAKQQEILLN